MFTKTYFLYLLGYALLTLLGVFYNRVFYIFLTLDIIERSLILQNIINAVKINLGTLGMTSILGLVIMFIYVINYNLF